jgi:hypothetical protein
MRDCPEVTNKEYTTEECAKITKIHRKYVMDVMNIFYHKLKDL